MYNDPLQGLVLATGCTVCAWFAKGDDMSDIGAVTSEIDAQSTKTALSGPALDKASPPSSPSSDAEASKATENTDAVGDGGRTGFDTVTLSEGGQKIINLARGNELADDIRSRPVDENFARKLFEAMQDIFRITRLFSENIKTAFQLRRW